MGDSTMVSRTRRHLAIAIALGVTLPLAAVATPANAAAAKRHPWLAPQHLTPVATSPAKVNAPLPDVAKQLAAKAAPIPAPVWPGAGSADITLARPSAGRVSMNAVADPQGSVTLAGMPIRVTAHVEAVAGPGQRSGVRVSPPTKVRVENLSRQQATALHQSGPVLAVSRVDGGTTSAPVTVSLGYSGLASSFGGDWSARLRLMAVPACASTTPNKPGCQATPVPSTNNVATQSVSADISLAPSGGSVMLAADAGSNSAGGDFTATPLSPSATWSAGGSTGDFNWNYPLRVPPAMGGPQPNIAFSYSAQSLDGLTSAVNTQPSWVGDGFSYDSGFIERKYQSCTDDGQTGTGDQCWALDNATLSMGGHGGELLQDSSNPDLWHPAHDDGTRVQRLRDTSLGNGDNDG
ncbi:MAG: hypothetical protein ACM3JP_00100, partial [Betaproteobacteria bacterium]